MNKVHIITLSAIFTSKNERKMKCKTEHKVIWYTRSRLNKGVARRTHLWGLLGQAYNDNSSSWHLLFARPNRPRKFVSWYIPL